MTPNHIARVLFHASTNRSLMLIRWCGIGVVNRDTSRSDMRQYRNWPRTNQTFSIVKFWLYFSVVASEQRHANPWRPTRLWCFWRCHSGCLQADHWGNGVGLIISVMDITTRNFLGAGMYSKMMRDKTMFISYTVERIKYVYARCWISSTNFCQLRKVHGLNCSLCSSVPKLQFNIKSLTSANQGSF